MKLLGAIGAGLAIIIVLIVATFLIAGTEKFWRFFGDPDLGPVLFERLERRSTPNDALACPPGLCIAKSDVSAPLYAKTAHDLRLAFSKVIASEPRVSVVDADDMTLTDRYIQRSQYFGFPDTIVVRFLDGGNGWGPRRIQPRNGSPSSSLRPVGGTRLHAISSVTAINPMVRCLSGVFAPWAAGMTAITVPPIVRQRQPLAQGLRCSVGSVMALNPHRTPPREGEERFSRAGQPRAVGSPTEQTAPAPSPGSLRGAAAGRGAGGYRVVSQFEILPALTAHLHSH